MNRRDVRQEIDIDRRLTGIVRTAFERSPDLQAAPEFTDTLRERLREAAVRDHRSTNSSRRWFLLAAGVALAAGLSGAIFFHRRAAQTEALARDAVGDHRNCALKFRLVRTPVPLEEAAQRFDSAYRLLLSAPPDDIFAYRWSCSRRRPALLCVRRTTVWARRHAVSRACRVAAYDGQ